MKKIYDMENIHHQNSPQIELDSNAFIITRK